MATIKKNQLANIIFPMVDGTDFASIESGITASDFNSAATKKFYGVTHGNSTAFTSGTISKATSLVRSGIFQQTLKASETNYDYLMVRFTHPSCADQLLIFHPVDYDDSDLMSRLSDVGSDLLSYLTGMSGMLSDVQSAVDSQFLIVTSLISDVDSQLLLNASMISDVQSALDSQFLIITSNISDVDSQLNLIPLSVSDSDMSDIVSRVWAAKYTTHSAASSFGSLFSDVYSRLALTQSNVSDIQSALDSQFSYLSGAVSDAHSDLRSQISGITVSVTASDISDIASAVWANTIGARVDSRITLIQSNVSDVESQLDLNASMISDVQSALDSQFVYLSGAISDAHSDLRSQISGITASVSASDISDIASAVWAAKYGTHSAVSSFGSLFSDVYSRIVLIQSNASDIESQLDVTHSLLSDVESQVDLLATSNYLSQVHSDLRSQIGGITASVGASDISDIASAVWANAIGARVDSRVLVIQSLISDVDSQLDLNASMISDVYSNLSDFKSDFQSRVPKAVATNSQLSDLASDLRSYLVGLSGMVSDVDSQLDVTHSLLSDVESQVDLLATSNYLSQIHSDLTSQIGGITVSVTASDISDIASAVWADTIGARVDSRVLVLQSMVSDVDSQLNLTASVVSDIQSALDSQYAANSNYLSQIHSDLYSAVGNVTVTLTTSDISDIASAVTASVGSNISDIYSLLQDVDSQLTVTHSLLSDVESQIDAGVSISASDISDIRSAISAGAAATVTASDISDIASAVWAASTRTLTTPTNTTATVSSGTITVYRGDSWSIAITGLGSLTGYTNIWFTVKNSTGDADTAALVQIDKTTGLLYSNAAVAGTAANGSITVDDASAGDITIALDEAESKNLSPSNGLHYDVQVLNGGDVTTLTLGILNLTADVTRSVS